MARYQHTVQLTEEQEQAWRTYRANQHNPEGFSALVARLIQQEIDRENANA